VGFSHQEPSFWLDSIYDRSSWLLLEKCSFSTRKDTLLCANELQQIHSGKKQKKCQYLYQILVGGKERLNFRWLPWLLRLPSAILEWGYSVTPSRIQTETWHVVSGTSVFHGKGSTDHILYSKFGGKGAAVNPTAVPHTFDDRATALQMSGPQTIWTRNYGCIHVLGYLPSHQAFRPLLSLNRSFQTTKMLLWPELIEILSCLFWCDIAALLQTCKQNMDNVNIFMWPFLDFWPPVFSLCFLLLSNELLI